MKKIFFTYTFFLSLSLLAQDYDKLSIPDSLRDLGQLELMQIPLCSCIDIYNIGIIQDDSTYQNIFYTDYVKKYCSEFIPSKIDFTKNSLLCISHFADCNARFQFKIFIDELKEEIFIDYVFNIGEK